MNKRKKKTNLFGFKDKFARRRTLFVIGVILIIILLNIIFGGKTNYMSPKNVSFLLDNEIINLTNEMFLDDNGTIYLSKEDASNLFDKNIYYNEAEKELITTYNKHIALLKVDEKFMVVNDSNVQLTSPMIEKNKIIYLPLSDMGIVYDIEFEYSKNNKRVIADSLSKEKNRVLSLRKFWLKEKTGIFSKKVEKIEHGEYLFIVQKNGKYYKVRSTDGNIGYVKQSKISDLEKMRDDLIEEKHEYNILKDASDINKDFSKAKLNEKKKNIVIPNFLYLDYNDSKPQILDKTNSSKEEVVKYTNWVKENNIDIWPTLSNNSEVSNCLRTYTDRNKVINDLYYILVEHEFKGININFEKIDDVNSFNRFIIELTPRLKELGLKVAVTANKNIDKEKIKEIVDVIIE